MMIELEQLAKQLLLEYSTTTFSVSSLLGTTMYLFFITLLIFLLTSFMIENANFCNRSNCPRNHHSSLITSSTFYYSMLHTHTKDF